MKQFIKFFIALAAMTVSTTSAWGETKAVEYLWYNNDISAFDSNTQSATKITSESNNLDGRYYVEGDVTINSTVTLSGGTRIYLCDGATLTINAPSGKGIDLNGKYLNIYGQSSGILAGKLIINSGDYGIYGTNDVTIHGGIIEIKSTSDDGIECKKFTLYGGYLSPIIPASGASGIHARNGIIINDGYMDIYSGQYGLFADDGSDVTINGGYILAMGFTAGICSTGATILGWTNAEDYIYANKYSGAISTASGKAFFILEGGTLDGGVLVDHENVDSKRLTPKPDELIYNISRAPGVSADNVSFDRVKAIAGERLAFNVIPPTGKLLTSITYNDGNGDHALTRQANDYVFTMPAHDVTVSATFATAVAQIGDTKYANLAAALAAVKDGETITILSDKDESGTDYSFGGYYDTRSITIDMNGCTVSFGNITNKYGDLTITDNSTNHNGIFNFGTFGNQGNTTIKDVTVNCNWIDNAGGSDHTLTFDNAKVVCSGSGIQWMSSAGNVVLTNGADVEVHNTFFLAYDADNNFTITGDATILKLIGCKFTGYVDNSDKIRPYVKPDLRSSFAFEVEYGTVAEPYVLRSTWGLMLTDNFGGNATVTFYAGGTSEPTGFDVTNPGETIVTANPGDWIVAHIVPDGDHWTDRSLLMTYEAKSSLSRTRGPGMEIPGTLSLLPIDTSNPATASHALRPDGGGWYYYQIPTDHSVSEGYTSSIINGEMVKKFDLSFDTWSTTDEVTYSNNIIKATHGTADAWTAEITLDKLSFPFTLEGSAPTFTKVEIKYNGTTKFSLTTAADIAKHLLQPTKQVVIGTDRQVRTNAASAYTWFKRYTDVGSPDVYIANGSGILNYEITVPLTVEFDSKPKGASDNPWLITSAADLVMLSNCVNVGQHDFAEQYLWQTKDLDMTGIAGFVPIGFNYARFSGRYDGRGKEISNLNISYTAVDPGDGDAPDINLGLFGQVYGGNASLANVNLKNCTFQCNATDDANVGGIAGLIDIGVDIMDCTVTGCIIKGGGNKDTVGGIVGRTGENCQVLDNIVTDCTVGVTGCFIGGIVGVAAGTDDGGCLIQGNCVNGTAESSMLMQGGDNAVVGAIFGATEINWSLQSNTYNYNVWVKHGETVRKGYMLRGYRNCAWDAGLSTFVGGTWADMTGGPDDTEYPNDVEGGMMEIYPVYLGVAAPTDYTATLQIDADPSTAAMDALVAGQTCYKIQYDTPFLGVGDVKTLVAPALLERTDDGRTFHADLTSLILNDGTTETDLRATMTFTMPSGPAMIAGEYTEANWFTIDTNQKQYMSFYHEWQTSGGTSQTPENANYTVTDAIGNEKIDALTITGADILRGTITTGKLYGISYSGMPTLFYCENKLPAKLKFTPVADASANVRPWEKFKGVTADKDMSGFTDVYVLNGIGDFYRTNITTDDHTLKAHRCYIDLGNIAGVLPARLHISGEATGIDSMFNVQYSMFNGPWYSLDGRKLDGKPTQKGIYINGGRKVIIK